MDELTRRRAFQKIAGAGLITVIAPGAAVHAADEEQDNTLMTERDCVLGSGMTADEADCWELTAKLAGKFFELPELHPMDKEEITLAIHVIQYRLLSRPTYRRYKELHKKLPAK